MDEKTHEPLLSILTQIVETAVKLRRDGHRVVIVSSGAIGVGLRRMDVDRRPKLLPQVQARQMVSALGFANLLTGIGSHWTMSPNPSVGQPVRTLAAANCSDSAYQKRYCRSYALPQCSKHFKCLAFNGCHTDCERE